MEMSLEDEIRTVSSRLQGNPLGWGEMFRVYQVAVEAILVRMLETMPDDAVDDWLTNDSDLQIAKMTDKEDDAQANFYRLVFARIRQGVESRRNRRDS